MLRTARQTDPTPLSTSSVPCAARRRILADQRSRLFWLPRSRIESAARQPANRLFGGIGRTPGWKSLNDLDLLEALYSSIGALTAPCKVAPQAPSGFRKATFRCLH